MSVNRRSDPHDWFTVLLPGPAHFRAGITRIRLFSVSDGLFALFKMHAQTELF